MQKEVLGLPKRQSKVAKRMLESDIPLQLAEHLLKYIVMPKAQARNHWKAEISDLLNKLLFGICERTNLVNGDRCIVALHYTIDEVIEVIDEHTMDATSVLKKYKSERFVVPSNFEDGNLFDYGYELKQVMNDKCITWVLSLNSTVVVKATGN